ncbi:hypothetical protein ACHAXN_000684 [Cyclotella atomus]
MTSWLGSLWGSSTSSLPYDLSSSPEHTTRSGWSLHTATPKQKTSASSESYSAFRAAKSELAKCPLRAGRMGGETQLIPALHHFQRQKRLVHPKILRAHATLDTDYSDEKSAPGLNELSKTLTTGTLIIVTEKVIPLDEWLDNTLSLSGNHSQNNAQQISWGIYNLVEALVFLHNQAKLAHGNVSPDAIYVTPGGDFKLGGFDLVTPLGNDQPEQTPTHHFRSYDPAGVCPDDYRSPERLSKRYDAMTSDPVHSMDCYSLAILIEYIYSHPNAGSGGKVPPALQKALARMKNDSPKLRPRLQPLLKCPVFDNAYVKMQLFLDEAMAKPVEERIAFLQNCIELLNRGVIDEKAAVYKLLPLLIMILKSNAGNEQAMSQEVNRRQVLAVVPLLFQVAELYLTKSDAADSKETPFQTHIAPLIPSLFGINDRGVRGAILQKIHLLESQLDKSTLNTQVFDPMCSGFTDTSGPLRELTLKSTIVLVPKLNAASLEKLVRYLVRLQSDPEASIRTNTIIFVGKVAPNLSEVSRQKLILPAFTRAMKDPFTPCRLAALKAVTACKTYFTQRDVSEKVLPCIIPFLLDASKDVRVEAFTVVDMFLVGLREESGRMGDGGGEGGGGQSGASGIGAAPTSGGYLSGLSSWMSTSTDPAAAATTAPSAGVATTNPVAPAVPSSANGSGMASNNPNAPRFSSLSLSDTQIGGASKMHANSSPGGWDDGDDGWGDDDFGSSPGGAKTKSDDDDFFASFDSSKPKTVSGTGMSASRPAPKLNQSSGLKVKKMPKPAVKKLPVNDSLDEGWDDF